MSLLVPILLLACGPGVEPQVPGEWTPRERVRLERMRLAPPGADPSNRFGDDRAAAELGQALFFDPGLSGSGAFACAHCHAPDTGFADGKVLSAATGEPERHTPAIPGCQEGPFFGWTGDTDSLWAQAIGPILSEAEMASSPQKVLERVQSSHSERYTAVFGPLPEEPDATAVLVDAAKAIAAYERLLVPEPSRFDRYLEAVLAGDTAGGGHLDAVEVQGLSLFLRDGLCVECHHGPMLTDGSFHNLAVPEPYGYEPGRSKGARVVLESPYRCTSEHSDTDQCDELTYLDPSFEDFQGAIKTPTLRNVAQTAPYFHNGVMPDLAGVMEFYDDLPGDSAFGHRELILEPLELEEDELSALVRFLETLDAEVPSALRQRVAPR